MAKLYKLGEYEGPGEEKTAETLAEELPNNWDVITGRKLPGIDRADTDLIVIGKSLVFLLEEKAWGPEVVVDDVVWQTSHKEYKSPLDRVGYLSRRLGSMLGQRIGNYRKLTSGSHVVTPGVVLSHDNLDLSHGPGYDSRELVVALREKRATERLKDLDRAASTLEPELRQNILDVVLGLGKRELGKLKIDIYDVESELPPIGRARQFLSSDPTTGTPLVLLCYPLSGWGPGEDPQVLLTTEARALAKVQDLGRTWQGQTPFQDPVHGYFVTPLVRPRESRNLAYSVKAQDPERMDGTLPGDVCCSVVLDAFEGLSEVHAEGLIHRALCPERIWIGRKLKVKFTDFLMAKISTDATISPWLEDFSDDESVKFRAPECELYPELATARSDVFSLALCLCLWLLNKTELNGSFDEVKEEIERIPNLGPILAQCLELDPVARPEASQVSLLIRELIGRQNVNDNEVIELESPDVEWELKLAVGDHRYLIEERLGEGGYATSWRAYDEQGRRQVVLKRFRDGRTYEDAREEFEAAERFSHDRLATVLDISKDAHPTFLVYRFVPGNNLKAHFQMKVDLDAEECRRIAIDVLDGLSYIHGKGRLHRDVTPGNVIIDSDGRALLIDFGLSGETTDGVKGLTPEYSAPELFSGSAAPSVGTDLFGFAASMLYCMLGRHSYPREADGSKSSQPSPPTMEEEAQWGPLGASILKCLFRGVARDPETRPASADQFKEQICLAISEPGVPGTEVENPTVGSLRRLYRASTEGNAGNRGIDDEFARMTYTRTRLDEKLPEAIRRGEFSLVALTGNPGDGKTSFLAMLYDQLKDDPDFEEIVRDSAGWRVRVGDQTLIAVNDASESKGDMSSDDLLHDALKLIEDEEVGKNVVLLAVNDGRLLQFFSSNSDLYPKISRSIERQLRENESPTDGVAVVDLKMRSLAGFEVEGSLADKVLGTLTSDKLWAVCDGCSSRDVCPILSNVHSLRSGGRFAVSELVLSSHLRRKRRATFRDLRSSAAWIITRDRACQEIHQARIEGQDLRKTDMSMSWDLAFDSEAADFLIKEWSDLDPGNVPAPEVERQARRDGIIREEHGSRSTFLAQIQRRIFFGDLNSERYARESVMAYRYIDDFVDSLVNPSEDTKATLLLGLSRVTGAPGYSSEGLAISASEMTSGWAVLKVVESEAFILDAPKVSARFVETIPDRLRLRHRDGASLELTLDTFELICRARNGEILNDPFSDALRQELVMFTTQLRRQPSQSVLVYDSLGIAFEAKRSDSDILLTQVEGS